MKPKLFFTLTLTTLVSCTNDFINNLPIDLEKTINVDKTVESFFIDHSKVLSQGGLSMCSVANNKTMQEIDLSLFFSEDKLFPVYKDNTKNLLLVDYNTFKEDTTYIHIKYDKLERHVEELLSSKKQYDVWEITWKYRELEFISYALFDIDTHELEYDNVLSNVFDTYVDHTNQQYLYVGEGPRYVTESATYSSSNNNMTVNMMWYYSGYFANVTTPLTNSTTTTWRYYFPESCGVSHVSYSNCDAFNTIATVSDISGDYYGLYRVRIGVWESSSFLLPSSPMTPPNVKTIETDGGYGYIYDKMVEE